MKDIILISRYREKHVLKHLYDNTYVFLPKDGYMRAGYFDDNKTIAFVDPSGGPFLHVGTTLEENKKKILSIDLIPYKGEKQYAITFE